MRRPLSTSSTGTTTRRGCPAKLHGQLLDIFTRNLFSKPGALTVLGTPIDLSEVTCDKYVVAGMTDHITPWKGVYNTRRDVRRQYALRAEFERPYPEPDQSARQSEGEVLPQSRIARQRRRMACQCPG